MRIVFCSSIRTPTMSDLCENMNKYCEAHFLYYTEPTSRPKFWSNSRRSENCFVAEKGLRALPGIYFSNNLLNKVKELEPDVVILGGILIPTNIVIYRWAIKRGLPVFLFSEAFGFGDTILGRGQYFKSWLFTSLIRKLFKNMSAIFAVGQAGREDFIRMFGAASIPVVQTQYPVDITQHLRHVARRPNSAPRVLFPHRLVDIYNPELAIRWFAQILKEFPGAKLGLNAFGEKREEISALISEIGIVERRSFLIILSVGMICIVCTRITTSASVRQGDISHLTTHGVNPTGVWPKWRHAHRVWE